MSLARRCGPHRHVAFSGYDAPQHERPATAGPPQPAAVRRADTSILWWWSFLFLVSAGNLILWLLIAREMNGLSDGYVAQQLWLSGIFAAACAFRSVLPRVDLERQCLWNSPLSSIFVGRSVATVAELCFARQCALLISKLSALTGNPSLQVVGWSIVPLILLAQVCCWYAVVSLNHLGHAIEEILWSVMVFLVALSLALTWDTAGGHQDSERDRDGGVRRGRAPDAGRGRPHVPRAMAAREEQRRAISPRDGRAEGCPPAAPGRTPLERMEARGPWMSLYFSAGVWLSFCLVFV